MVCQILIPDNRTPWVSGVRSSHRMSVDSREVSRTASPSHLPATAFVTSSARNRYNAIIKPQRVGHIPSKGKIILKEESTARRPILLEGSNRSANCVLLAGFDGNDMRPRIGGFIAKHLEILLVSEVRHPLCLVNPRIPHHCRLAPA